MADTHAQGQTPDRRDAAPASPPQTTRQDWPSMADFRRDMDSFFEDFTRAWFRPPQERAGGAGFGLQPAVDVTETDDAYRITAEVPGVAEKDLDVSVSGGILTIRGEKSETREESQQGMHLSERRFGSFRRSFSLPPGVDAERIEARRADGVLTVTVPKAGDASNKPRRIDVKAS